MRKNQKYREIPNGVKSGPAERYSRIIGIMLAIIIVLAIVVMFLCYLLASNRRSSLSGHSLRNTVDHPSNTLVLDSSTDNDAIEEVEEALRVLVKGIEQNNSEGIFSIFSTMPDARYIRNGHIYAQIGDAEEQYAVWLSGLRNRLIHRKFDFIDKHYEILSSNIVLFTGLGAISGSKLVPDDDPWIIAYTILWVKEADEWKALNMHISWE